MGINVADTRDDARAFVDRYGWTWPSIQDRARARARSLGAEYQPYVIVVDAEGRIAGSLEGRGEAATWEALADRVS